MTRFDALLHAWREEFMRGVHDAHAQCSRHGYTYLMMGGAGARGGAQGQSMDEHVEALRKGIEYKAQHVG